MDTTKILPGLFQGSAPDSARAVKQAGFQLLVLCAREIQPPEDALQGLTALRCPLVDNDDPIDNDTWSRIWRTAHTVAHEVESHRAALVTCAMGWNRSGLVTGVAVHLLTGWDGGRVVSYIQSRRPNALGNLTFVEALRKLRAAA